MCNWPKEIAWELLGSKPFYIRKSGTKVPHRQVFWVFLAVKPPHSSIMSRFLINSMLGFMEILVLGMVMFLLLKRHSLREWGLALKHSVFEFKKALHEKAEREVKEYRSENGQRLSLKGDSDVR